MTLRTELQTDPAGLGYDLGNPAQIESVINARTRTHVVSTMRSERGILERYPDGPLVADAVLRKLEAFSVSAPQDQTAAALAHVTARALKFLGQPDGIDIGSPATQSLLTTMAAAGVLTADEASKLKALAVVPCSRAEEIGLGYVTDQMIKEALQ